MGKCENLFCERILKDNSRQKHEISYTEAVTIAWGRDTIQCNYLHVKNEI
jgi:hypothetical protein